MKPILPPPPPKPRDRIARLKAQQMSRSKQKQDVGSRMRSARNAALIRHGKLTPPKS